MNDEVKDRLVRYLGTLEEMTRAGADTASEQLPDIAQQFVAWHLWSNTIWATWWFAVMCILVYGLVRMWLWAKGQSPEDVGGPCCFATVLGGAGVVGCFSSFCLCADGVLKALVAPKVLVLEEVIRLIGAAT